VKLPPQVKVTEGGIHLPDNSKQKFCYGRVVSVGEDVQGGPLSRPTAKDVILFDHQGMRSVALHPIKDEGYVVIHDTMVYAILDEAELTSRELPLP